MYVSSLSGIFQANRVIVKIKLRPKHWNPNYGLNDDILCLKALILIIIKRLISLCNWDN